MFNAVKSADEPIAGVKCDLSEVNDDKNNANAEMKKCDQKLVELQKEEKSIKTSLETAKPRYAKLGEDVRAMKYDLVVLEEERSSLLSKQACKDKYQTVEERNAFLKDQYDKSKKHHDDKVTRMNFYKKELDKFEKELKSAQKEVSEYNAKKSTMDTRIKDAQGKASNCTNHLGKISESLREKLATRQELHTKKNDVDKDKQFAVERIQKTMRYHQKRGNEASLKLGQDNAGSWGKEVRGTLLDHIKVPEEFRICAEMIAGASLFNLLVDTDDTASKLVTHVRKNKYGMIVATPINKIPQDRPQYPDQKLSKKGMKPLIDVIKYPQWAAPAVYQVFGNFIVVNNLDDAMTICTDHRLCAITLDGDQLASRGVMKGGFVDPNKYHRLKSMAKVRDCTTKMKEYEAKLVKIDDQIKALRDQQEVAHTERAGHEKERDSYMYKLKLLREHNDDESKKVADRQKHITEFKESVVNLESDVKQLAVKLKSFQDEMATKTLNNLNEQEQNRLNELHALVRDQQSSVDEMLKEYYGVGNATKTADARLVGFVQPQITKFENDRKKFVVVLGDCDERKKTLTERLKELQATQKDKQDQFEQCQDSIRKCNAEKDKLRKALTRTQNKRTKADNKLQEIMATVDDLGRQFADCLRLRGASQQRIRSFTSIPLDEQIQEFVDLTSAELDKELKIAQDTVVKFKDVNKKAFDQYDVYSYEVNRLTTEVQRLQDCEIMLNEQLDGYYNRRDNVIEITCKVVNKFFKYIFSCLVPGGSAALTIVRNEVDGKLIGVRPHLSFKG